MSTTEMQKAFTERNIEIENLKERLIVAKVALEKCDMAIRAMQMMRQELNGNKINPSDVRTVASNALAKMIRIRKKLK